MFNVGKIHMYSLNQQEASKLGKHKWAKQIANSAMSQIFHNTKRTHSTGIPAHHLETFF